MALTCRFNLESRPPRALLVWIALRILPSTVFFFVLTSLYQPLWAQSPGPTSGGFQDSKVEIQPAPVIQVPVSQVQTSAQNPVFGSVPESKPTPGVLALTFKDAIERALRQNLAGLLSEYNTIEARGEKWQQLSRSEER